MITDSVVLKLVFSWSLRTIFYACAYLFLYFSSKLYLVNVREVYLFKPAPLNQKKSIYEFKDDIREIRSLA
jgi:hypothetical protein